MRVLVIPEDSRRDKDLLKPLIEALMAEIGRPRAKVRVCEKPVLGGVAEALKWERIREIIDLWGGQTDLFLLVVDRDGEQNAGRARTIASIEEQSASLLGEARALLGEVAIEEVEVWVLAGLDLPADWRWKDIRTETHPKEVYFAKFLTEHRNISGDAAGRIIVAQEAARNMQRILALCPEDLGRLATRLRELL